jgi:hypothetical protein
MKGADKFFRYLFKKAFLCQEIFIERNKKNSVMQNTLKEAEQFDANAFARSHAAREYVKLFYFPVERFDREKIAYCNTFRDFHSSRTARRRRFLRLFSLRYYQAFSSFCQQHKSRQLNMACDPPAAEPPPQQIHWRVDNIENQRRKETCSFRRRRSKRGDDIKKPPDARGRP